MARFTLSAVVGVIAGFATGNPGIGFQAFAVTYGLAAGLDPNQKVKAPYPDLSRVPGANYGDPLPYVIGVARVPGVIAWASEKRAIANTTTTGGKGAPGVDSTTYTTVVDVFYLLTANEMEGLRRIWSYGKLVWTAAADADTESIDASSSTDSWERMTFYTGAADQLPDPDMEAFFGVGNTPAYRHRSGVFIKSLVCAGGDQLPLLNFEVVQHATLAPDRDTWLLMTLNASPVDQSAYAHSAIASGDVAITSDARFGAGGLAGSKASANKLTITPSASRPVASNEPFCFEVSTKISNTGDNDGNHFFAAGPITVGSYEETMYVALDAPLGSGNIEFPILPGWNDIAIDRNSNGTLVIRRNGTAVYSGTHSAAFGVANVVLLGTTNNDTADTVNVDNVRITFGRQLHDADYQVVEVSDETVGLVTPVDQTLEDAVTQVLQRTGLLGAADFDVSAFDSKTVRGLSINQVTSARAVLEIFCSGYLAHLTEGDQIIGGYRGGAPAVTIPYEDMGASEGDPIPEPLPIRRSNDIEQASRVTIKYINSLNDYQTGAEAGERLITESTSDSVTEIALALTPGEAKKLADVATMDIAIGLLSIGPINVTRKYAGVEVNDVALLVNSDGSTYRTRITKITDSGLIRTFECVLDDATIVNSAAATDEDYTSTSLVRNSSATVTELFDGPILRDADNDSGFYVLQNGGEKWPGATLRLMPDGASLSTITERAVFGECATTLGDWTGPRIFDDTSTVTVNVGSGELSSSTRDAVLNDQTINAFAIGVDGRWECGQFKTASLISPGVYILSGFLRGGRGTEWAMTGHTSGETFLLLQPTGMRRVPMETTLLGIERTYRGVTLGRQIDSADDIDFTNMGVGLKPFSPFDLRASRDGDDITLTWQRRSRLSTRTIGPLGISIPLGESVEAYSIDIYDDNTYTTVVRTLTSTTTSVEYSAADQTADFGSPQATVYVGIFQLSAQVGRGYELQAAA